LLLVVEVMVVIAAAVVEAEAEAVEQLYKVGFQLFLL
jgi:hypothetical protein